MKNEENEKILKRVKQKISISKFEEEESMNIKNINKSIVKTVVVFCCIMISITGLVFAKNVKYFIKGLFGINTSDGVDIAVNNGYIANVNTEYQNAKGIEIQVDSILMDDFNFDINFNVNLNDNYDTNEFERIDFEDLIITDETEKIVFNTYNAKFETEEMKGKTYMGSYSFLTTKTNKNTFKVALSATGNPDSFPKSKQITVDFTKIKTFKYVNEERIDKVYQGNWHYEIDVPEEFYNRKSIIYKAKSCNDNSINVDKVIATISNTAFKISIPEIETNKVNYEALHNYDRMNIHNMIALQKEYVETSDGKRFETAQRSDGDGGYGIPKGENKIIDYHQTFNLTKYDATNKITLHIFTNKGEEIIIDLEKNS